MQYKLYYTPDGAPARYMKIIEVPSRYDVGDWLEANGYDEAYNYDWKVYNQPKKKKTVSRKKTVSKKRPYAEVRNDAFVLAKKRKSSGSKKNEWIYNKGMSDVTKAPTYVNMNKGGNYAVKVTSKKRIAYFPTMSDWDYNKNYKIFNR